MVRKQFLVDPSELDFENVIADIDEIRKYNRQRYEMEQLTAVIYEDLETATCVGYKEITATEFWVRGHMPGVPLMPGVMMCEAAAQLCSYFATRYDFLGAPVVGFGGMENIRFREPVYPGCRLVIACRQTKVRRGAMIACQFQGVVEETIVVDGLIKGIPLPLDLDSTRQGC